MPKCTKCNKAQSLLNETEEGDFCKNCFAEHVENKLLLRNNKQDKTQNNSSKDDMNAYLTDHLHEPHNISEAKIVENDVDFWTKMDQLLDKKLSIQEEKIKQAVVAEVTGKLNDLTKQQKKLEDENKTFRQKMTVLETRQKNVENENNNMKRIINRQQGHIIQQDKQLRQKRLLISGLSETETLTYNEESADSDDKKIKIIFKALNTSIDDLVDFKRIGSPDQGPDNRPRYLLMQFIDIESRKTVKEKSSNLNGIEELKHIRIKADLTKQDREEYSRLFKLKENLEKDNPGKNVRYERGKIYLEEEVIDEFKSSSKKF